MAKVNTTPLSGMRDFLPRAVLQRNYVVDVITRVYQSYGFEPLETPTMERLTTLLGKYGEEGDQLIFRILKRGEKLERALANAPTEASVGDAGLRYDLTVPLARVYAEYRNELPRYFKRYQIQPVYRADRPAKGRYREFYQCDVDVVGSNSKTVEAEVLTAAAEIFDELGFGEGDNAYAIRMNHRGVLRGLLEVTGVPPEKETDALIAIDKLDKIGAEGVAKDLQRRGIPAEIGERLLETLARAPEENMERVGWLSDLLEDSDAGSQGVNELKEVLTYCAEGPAQARLRIDPYLARGLSYYTGTIFEIEVAGLNGSAGAGGRYDELIGMFSGQAIPSCGISLGLERMLLVMDERNLYPPQLAGEPQLLVTHYDASTTEASLALARRLRRSGLRVDLYPDPGRYGRQFQYAEERRIRYALLVGPDEIASASVAVKDLESGEQHVVAASELIDWLSARLQGANA